MTLTSTTRCQWSKNRVTKIKVEIVGVYHRNVKIAMCLDSTYFPIIFKQNHSNDPDCDALTRAKERLLKQDKRGLDSSKPVLSDAILYSHLSMHKTQTIRNAQPLEIN